MSLEESLCKIFGHDWPLQVSGSAVRIKCGRCKADYYEYTLGLVTDIEKLLDEEGF